MSILVKATPAPRARTDATKQIAILYAGILVVLAVTQLFTFDKFIELIPTFELPLSIAATYALAPTLIAAEVFAIPFLLRMTLSPAFRALSMALGWLVALLWTLISLWVVLIQPTAETVGFLGTLVDLVPGWWAVLVSISFGILAAWASWGLWPGKRQTTKAKK